MSELFPALVYSHTLHIYNLNWSCNKTETKQKRGENRHLVLEAFIFRKKKYVK